MTFPFNVRGGRGIDIGVPANCEHIDDFRHAVHNSTPFVAVMEEMRARQPDESSSSDFPPEERRGTSRQIFFPTPEIRPHMDW